MPSGPGQRYDFFLSRRGSVAAIAQEVTDVLKESGYEVVVQDYDFQIGESWVLAIHDCIKSSRDLIILFTSDYEKSQYTREESLPGDLVGASPCAATSPRWQERLQPL
jgi:hypothetical protein